MTCSELDQHLQLYVDGEYGDSERDPVDAHLVGCPACAGRVLQERRFRELFRQKVREASGTAPLSLRLKVQQGLRAEVRRRRVRTSVRFAVAAAVLAAVGVTSSAMLPRKLDGYVSDAARRHARVLPHEIHGRGHEDVEAWFQGKLDHHVRLPRFSNAEIAGARLSNVQDRPAAYVRYEGQDRVGAPRTIGLFVFGDEKNDLGARPLPAASLESRLGYNVAVWRDGEIVYELVSDLDESDIRALLDAQLIRPAARD
jgi:anti-sigma factor RsiW